MKCKKIIKLFFSLMIIVVTGGCATYPAVKVENMIPSISPAQVQVSNRTLKVRNVTGGAKLPTTRGAYLDIYHEVKIDNANFQEALLKSVKNSELFKDVITSGNADYELVAEIAAQENTLVGVVTYNTHILINYSLIEGGTNKELWSEHIFSQHTEGGTFSKVPQSLRKMNEIVVKENLSQFIIKLSSFVKGMQAQEKGKP
jgi:hypothetical protein